MYSVYTDLRDKKGLKDADVARALGFHSAFFAEWKKGKSTPKYDKLKMIADYFGVSVEYLTTGEQPEGYYLNKETAEIAQEIFDNKELRLLFDASKNARPEQLKLLHEMMLSLKRAEQGYDGDDPA